MRFEDKLRQRMQTTGSSLCVGLDPRPERIEGPPGPFLEAVLDAPAPFAAADQPNIAYFEALGVEGYRLLEQILDRIPAEIPVILDAKRSDIPETQRQYARAYFEGWNVDAVTLNPLLGYDSVEPFLTYEGKGVYLLGLTSNAGAAELLGRPLEGRYLFELFQAYRQRAAEAGLPGSVGLVAGLTNLDATVLDRLDDLPLLVPGLGAQGGDLARLRGRERKAPILVNVSRGILYPEAGHSPAGEAAAYAARIRDVLPIPGA